MIADSLLRYSSLVVLLLLYSVACRADIINGEVTRVVDGDTVHVVDGSGTRHKIRLAGINAPERRKAYSGRATQYLVSLVYGKQVVVYWDKYDKYDRVVGKIICGGKDVNLALVRAGYAVWYRRFAQEQSKVDRLLYEFAENAAKRERAGLWAQRK